jgi:hypothetical protein
MLGARQAALVGAYAPVEGTKGLGDDDVVLVAVEDSRNGRRLRFGHRRDFFNHHALSFALGASTARGQSNHPQRHDALRIDAKLRSFQRYLEPRVEQGAPFAGDKRRRTSRRRLVRRTIWATSFSLTALLMPRRGVRGKAEV